MQGQTEVQRILTELDRAGTAGETLLRRFRSAVRGDVKLACALRGFFTEGEAVYLDYLRSRIRPAFLELTLSGRTEEMGQLDALGLLSPALAEELLSAAISAHVPDSIVWLLLWKQRCVGFEARELRL